MIRAITFATLLTLASTSVMAESRTEARDEARGLVGGLAVGAAIAGPPGAVAGGILGALLGDGFAASARAEGLQASLEQTRRELYAIEQERREWQERYELAMAEQNQSTRTVSMLTESRVIPLPASCCGNTLSLHFRSGSSTVETHYREQLAELANWKKLLPGTAIEIQGFADRRGDSRQNRELSRRRAESVRALLAEMGVDEDRIRTAAFGDSRPLREEQNSEGDFFDRRVVIRLSDDSSTQNAAMLSQSAN